ncbi:sulfatase [Candidatus Vecturithrix granuli]|uniref:Sulfatase n=1 Tax=Vecturithrix granuli TaxID=1499967 RepID=A0A081BYJ0_VECG1|nr:sulfatase [Candidatus Vecturithrix granuli]
MKHYMALVLICIGMFALVGCNGQPEKNDEQGNRQENNALAEISDFVEQHGLTENIDLLETFYIHQQKETSILRFRIDANPDSYLLHGWTMPESRFTWAVGDRSRVLFYRYDIEHDVEVEITCRSIASIENLSQITGVFVNDNSIGTFTPNHENFQHFTLTIPAQALRSGENIIEFRFTYTTKPSDIHPNSADSRHLAAAFQKISFQSKQQNVYAHEATQTIDFRQEAHPETFLLSGWQAPEKDRTWAMSRNSQVRFYTYPPPKNLSLKVVCVAIPSETHEKQIVRVHLNNTPIGTFTVNTNDFKEYTLKLPAQFLRFGENFLEFAFAYTSKVYRVIPDSKDNRNLSVAFRQIMFKNNSPTDTDNLTDGKVIIQRADSTISAIQSLPHLFELELDYVSMKGAAPRVRLLRDQQEAIEIELPPNEQTYRQSFQLDQPAMYKIQLITEGDSESYTRWKRVTAHVSSQNTGFQKAETRSFVRSSKPDILVYVVDTLRADHVGCYGYERNTTPNIDRFAQESAIFTNAYAADSWTKASAATIVSGLLPKHHETVTKKDKLPDRIVTLAEMLKENGYYTIGFTANGNFGNVFGFSQGFDEFRRFVDRQPVTLSIMSDVLNKSIIPFLQEYATVKDRKPLFLMIWTMDPHDPYTPDESVKNLFDIDQYEPINTYDEKFLWKIQAGILQPTSSQIEYIKTRYDQEVYFNDRTFGELLDTMKSVGLYDNAFILFTADHGEEFWDHGGVGHGRTLYNDQVKIPFIIKATQIPAGSYSRLVQHIDVYPTILDIIGGEEPYPLDGISLLHTPNPERTLFLEEDFDSNVLTASVNPEKKIIFNRQFHRPGVAEPVPAFEVFNFNDIDEQNNLGLNTLNDEFRFHELFFFINKENTLNFEHTEAEIPPELDEQLRDLGYVK